METYEEKIAKIPLLINGIFLTVALVLVQPLFTAPSLDVLQVLVLILFAIALLSVGGYAFIVYNALAAKVDPFKNKGSVSLSLQYIGLIAGILGIALIIWNTSWIAGGVFVITFFIVLLICAKAMNRITLIQKQAYPTPPPTQQQHNP